MKINIIGAFDRYNLGDLLFPYVVQNVIEKRFGSQAICKSFGIRKTNMHDYGGVDTESISNADKKSYFINAGGNTLTARIDYLYLDNIDNKCIFFLNRVFRKMIGDEKYIHYIQRKLNISDRFPYVMNDKNMYYNAVGGNLDELADIDKDYLIRVLSKAKYISVRDIYSRNSLKSYGINANLSPDSATVISDFWDKEYLKTYQKKELYNKHYVVFQISGSIGKEYHNNIIHMLKNVYKCYSKPILLLPIGKTISHGDIISLNKISKELPDYTLSIENINVKESVAAIAFSDMFIGSSLHGNIISFSYNVPSVLIASKGTKNYNYYMTWMQKSTCKNVYKESISDIEFDDIFNNVCNDVKSVDSCKKLVYKNFDSLFSCF